MVGHPTILMNFLIQSSSHLCGSTQARKATGHSKISKKFSSVKLLRVLSNQNKTLRMYESRPIQEEIFVGVKRNIMSFVTLMTKLFSLVFYLLVLVITCQFFCTCKLQKGMFNNHNTVFFEIGKNYNEENFIILLQDTDWSSIK